MKGFFVTGTDTGVGKTVTAAALTFALQGCYWKPIQSGLADDISDQQTVQILTGLAAQHFVPSTYQLQASLSPDQAAKREDIEIDLAHCQLPLTSQPMIVEGAGGVLVPLNAQASMLDLMQQIGLPVIIVSRGTLGTINHTLLTLGALRQRQIPIKGVVFSGEMHPDNQAAIQQFGQMDTLFHIPHFNNITAACFQTWVQAQQHNIREALA